MHAIRRTSCYSTARSSGRPSEDGAAPISPAKVWPFPYLRWAEPVGFFHNQNQRWHTWTSASLPPRIGRKENTDHGHPITEVVWVGRHGSINVTESVQSLNDPRRRSALNLVQKGETDVHQFLRFLCIQSRWPWSAGCRGARCGPKCCLDVSFGVCYLGNW